MRNGIKYFFLILIVLILPVTELCAFLVVDFQDLPNGKRRVIALNSETQKLRLYQEVRTNWEDRMNGYVITLKSSGRVKIREREDYSKKRKPMIIRSEHKISVHKECKGWKYENLDPFNVWASKKIKEIGPEEIAEILPIPKKKESLGAEFPIFREGHKSVRTLASLSDTDKGVLGELVTTLTMLSFGYTQHASKYEHDHGLDGVFENWSQEYLVLTQSKQGKYAPAAKTIMKNELNEKNIWEKIQKMESQDSELQQTAELIRKYIEKRPDSVYKFACRLMNKGSAQCLVNCLNIHEIPKEGLRLYNVSSKQKRKALQKTLETFEKTPENQLALALKSISLDSIPVEDAFKYLAKSYGFTDQELHSLIVKHTDNKSVKKHHKRQL